LALGYILNAFPLFKGLGILNHPDTKYYYHDYRKNFKKNLKNQKSGSLEKMMITTKEILKRELN
jgi:hypothetical protein